jgi:U3 small nucleolar RNA-associated protein 20
MMALTQDLRTTMLSSYTTVLEKLLSLLPLPIPASTLTQLLATLSSLWKYVLAPTFATSEFSRPLLTNNEADAKAGDKRPRPSEDQHISHADHLTTTWQLLVCTLSSSKKRCDTEVQRAVAEAWGGMLRRLKGIWREQALVILADTVLGVVGEHQGRADDACAWMVVFACKVCRMDAIIYVIPLTELLQSISQTLHTVAPSIFQQLLHHYLSLPYNSNSAESEGSAENRMFNLLRRTLTALVHHVKSADQFAPITELLIKIFEESIDNIQAARDEVDEGGERIRRCGRLMQVIAVPCSVRMGSRINRRFGDLFVTRRLMHGKFCTEPQLSSLLITLSNIPLGIPLLHQPILSFSTSVLVASPLALWMGPGRKALEYFWREASTSQVSSNSEIARLTIQLSGALIDLGWGGTRTLLLPMVIKNSAGILKSGEAEIRNEMLRLLVSLKEHGVLGEAEVDMVWKQRVSKWATERLHAFQASEEKVAFQPSCPLS